MKPKNTQQFIQDAIEVHGDKFDYSLVDYKGAKNPVKIKCSNNHIFDQKPNDHLNGFGCRYCCGWGIFKKDNWFVTKAKEIHGDKYLYNKTFYVENNTLLTITCKIHGDFMISPKEHLNKKRGCQICGKQSGALKRTFTNEQFIEKAKKVHGDLYDYSKVKYVRADKKVEIICFKHGSFFQTPKDHLNQKQGCYRCCFSKGELKIKNYLQENNIEYISQYKFKDCKHKRCLPFDFYLPKYNICIEFNGEQHYKLVKFFSLKKSDFEKLKKRDKIKIKFCKLYKIKYIVISYKNINKIEEILKEKIK